MRALYIRLLDGFKLLTAAIVIVVFPLTATAGENQVQVLAHVGHSSGVTAVALLEKEGLVITGSWDRSVIVWQAQTGDILRRIAPEGWVEWMHHELGTTRLWVGTGDRGGANPVQCFDVLTGRKIFGYPIPAVAAAEVAHRDLSQSRAMKDAASREVRELWRRLEPAVAADVTCYALGNDGRYALLGLNDGHAELWDIHSLHKRQSFQSRSASVDGLVCSGNGGRLVTWGGPGRHRGKLAVGEVDLRFWDLFNFQVRHRELPDVRGIYSGCLTSDGRFLYLVVAGYVKETFRILEIDFASGDVVRQIGPTRPNYCVLRLSSDDALLAISEFGEKDNRPKVWVWERRLLPATMRLISLHLDNVYGATVAFFGDHRRLLAGGWERPAVFDLASGSLVGSFTDKGIQSSSGSVQNLRTLPNADPEDYAQMVGFIADLDVHSSGRWVAYGITHRGIGGHEVVDLDRRTRWGGDISGLHHIRFRPGFSQVIVAGTHETKTVQVRRLDSGAVIDSWTESQKDIDRSAFTSNNGWLGLKDALAITADGKSVFLVKTDGAIRMLRLSDSGRITEGLELIAVGDADWAAVLPDGHYAGSPAGVASIRIVRKETSLPLSQFDGTLNRPDMVAEVIGAPREVISSLRRLADTHQADLKSSGMSPFTSNNFRPVITLAGSNNLPIQVDSEDYRLKLVITPTGERIRQLRIVVNGILWPGREGIPITPSENGDGKSQLCEFNVPLVHGINRINISAVSVFGEESLQQVVQVERIGQSQRHIRLLAVGVTEYADSEHNLNFAASDACVVKKLVHSWTDSSPTEIKSVVLTDAEATGERIRTAAANLFRSTGPDDLCVIFLSGHGTLDPDDPSRWYFCPHDFDFTNPRLRGLVFEQVTRLFDGVAARQRLLLIDSCHSGELDSQGPELAALQRSVAAKGVIVLSNARTVLRDPRTSGENQNAASTSLTMQDVFSDFRTRTGAAVIGASSGLQFALESQDLRQGVFTHALVEGISKGGADLNRDGQISASELHRFLADQVLSLTEGQQRPSSRGINPDGDFLITRTNQSVNPDTTQFLARYLMAASNLDGSLRELRNALGDQINYLGATYSRDELIERLRREAAMWQYRYFDLIAIDNKIVSDERTATLVYREGLRARRKPSSSGQDPDAENGERKQKVQLAWSEGGWQIVSIGFETGDSAGYEPQSNASAVGVNAPRTSIAAIEATQHGSPVTKGPIPGLTNSISDPAKASALARAQDSERKLNAVYSALRSRLNATGKFKLKEMQLGWLKARSAQTGINELLQDGGRVDAVTLNRFADMNEARATLLQEALRSLR